MEPKDEMQSNQIEGPSQESQEQTKPHKFPGCFKKAVAFIIDEIVITLLSIVIFFPFSGSIDSLYQHAWIPAFLLGGLYFAVLESSFWKSRSVGKLILSLKVNSIDGRPISPLVSFGRYLLITFPLLSQNISGSLTGIVGNNAIFSVIYLGIVVILLSGNTVFMLFHPQKRGLHDILLGTAVFPTKDEPAGEIINFTRRPVLGGVGFLVILALAFGGLYNLYINLYNDVMKNQDFADIEQLNAKIQSAANNQNISAYYKIFSFNGAQTAFAIEIHVPIPYDKCDDKLFMENISNRLYPIAKQVNTNPKVDTIAIVFNAKKYIGVFPINKSDRIPKKLSEIE